MEASEVYTRLDKQFPGRVRDLKADVFEPFLFVDAAAIVEICRFLVTILLSSSRFSRT